MLCRINIFGKHVLIGLLCIRKFQWANCFLPYFFLQQQRVCQMICFSHGYGHHFKKLVLAQRALALLPPATSILSGVTASEGNVCPAGRPLRVLFSSQPSLPASWTSGNALKCSGESHWRHRARMLDWWIFLGCWVTQRHLSCHLTLTSLTKQKKRQRAVSQQHNMEKRVSAWQSTESRPSKWRHHITNPLMFRPTWLTLGFLCKTLTKPHDSWPLPREYRQCRHGCVQERGSWQWEQW